MTLLSVENPNLPPAWREEARQRQRERGGESYFVEEADSHSHMSWLGGGQAKIRWGCIFIVRNVLYYYMRSACVSMNLRVIYSPVSSAKTARDRLPTN